MAFREKLSEQLTLIEEAQLKKSGWLEFVMSMADLVLMLVTAGSAHSSQDSSKSNGWVVVNSKPPEKTYYQ